MGFLSSKFIPVNNKTTEIATAVNNTPAQEPVVKQVDVMAMMSHLQQTGSAKLSDFATPVTVTEQTAPTPTPQTTPTHSSKTESKYVAPKDATEAKARIEAAIAKNAIVMEEMSGMKVFKGNTRALRSEFRLLGGDYNKETILWTVPVAYWNDPSKAIATKSEKKIAYEQRMAEQTAKKEAEQKAAVEAAVAAVTPEGMITIEQAKAKTLETLKLFLASLASTKPETLDKMVERVYAA